MLVTKFFLALVVLLAAGSSAALRCRTEDGPSVEEVKKVVRTCMNNQEEYSGGKNSNRNKNDDGESDESESDENREDERSSDHNNHYYENQKNQHSRGGDNRRNDEIQNSNHDRKNNNNQNDNRYQQQRYLFAERSNRFSPSGSHDIGQRQQLADYSANSWPHQNNGMRLDEGNNNDRNRSRDIDNQNSTSKNNQKEGESCMVLCFFKEMKMTNREGYPDRHKMLHIMTHELRDMQLKDFYTDTIQECHHILEMEQPRDKCAFARHLVTCFSERARTNCEDFQDSFIF